MPGASNPGWPTGYVPSAVEWANEWSNKVDCPAPVAQGGTGSTTALGAAQKLTQRQLISGTAPIALAPVTSYGCRTSIGAMTLNLPALSSVQLGDWIALADVDFDANTNTIQVFANGSDTIDVWGNEVTHATLNVAGVQGYIVANASNWTLVAGPLPPALLSAAGTELVVVTQANGDPATLTTAQIGGSGASGSQYYLQWCPWFNQTPQASELLALYVSPVNYVYLANFVGSEAAAPLVLPTASFVLTVQQQVGGTGAFTTIGTITVATSGATTFATAGGVGVTINAGDRLQVLGPGTADATIAGYAFTLKGQPPA